MYDDSRLGRESIEVGYALKKLIKAGVRVYYSRTGKECTLNGPLEKMMSSFERFASEMHRWPLPGEEYGPDLPAHRARRAAVSEPDAEALGHLSDRRRVEIQGLSDARIAVSVGLSDAPEGGHAVHGRRIACRVAGTCVR
jgi:hypothetical protein